MADTGRMAVFHGTGKPFEIREYPVPDPEPGAALIKIALANVCGSDMHYWRGEQDYVKMGRPLPLNTGHEHVGRVAKLGALPGVRVEANPTALNKYGIGLDEMRATLSADRSRDHLEAHAKNETITANRLRAEDVVWMATMGGAKSLGRSSTTSTLTGALMTWVTPAGRGPASAARRPRTP